MAGQIHTKEEVFKWLGQLADETGGTLRIVEVRDIHGCGDNVVALARFEARRNGKSLAWDVAQIGRVVNGKAVEAQGLTYDQYALDELMS